MAVTTEVESISYAGNASTTTAYVIPFPFLSGDHIRVAVDGVTLSSASIIVMRLADGSGGSVRTAAAVDGASTVVITREVPLTQPAVFPLNGPFPSKAVEKALDRLTMLIQQVRDKFTTALAGKVPTSRTVNGKPLSADIVLVKGDIGLANVDNTPDAAKPVSTAQAAAISAAVNGLVNGAPGALDTLQELAAALGNDASFATTVLNSLAARALASRTVNGKPLTADVVLVKGDIGLGNAENTADAAKPISTAAAAALAGKVAISDKATLSQANGGTPGKWIDAALILQLLHGPSNVPFQLWDGENELAMITAIDGVLTFENVQSVAIADSTTKDQLREALEVSAVTAGVRGPGAGGAAGGETGELILIGGTAGPSATAEGGAGGVVLVAGGTGGTGATYSGGKGGAGGGFAAQGGKGGTGVAGTTGAVGGNGGSVYLSGGDSKLEAGGNAGNFQAQGGAAGTGVNGWGGDGGAFLARGGNGGTTGHGGIGGNFLVYGGNGNGAFSGGDGGSINASGGGASSTQNGGTGGQLLINANGPINGPILNFTGGTDGVITFAPGKTVTFPPHATPVTLATTSDVAAVSASTNAALAGKQPLAANLTGVAGVALATGVNGSMPIKKGTTWLSLLIPLFGTPDDNGNYPIGVNDSSGFGDALYASALNDPVSGYDVMVASDENLTFANLGYVGGDAVSATAWKRFIAGATPAKTANYTATLNDGLIPVNAAGGAVTITLPAISPGTPGTGIPLKVVKIDSSANAVTIQRSGSNTINGGTSATLTTQWQGRTFHDAGLGSWVNF